MAEATTTPTPTAVAQATTPAPEQSGEDGKGGKAAVLADLATERDKRQELERQIQQLTTAQQAQTEALAKAFGLKSEETSDVSRLAEQVTALKKDFTETQHANVVLSVANEHGISDKDDLALLSAVKDETQLRTLAARLSKASEGGTTSHTPKPDRTQGGKGGSLATTPRDAFAQFMGQRPGA